MKRLNSTAKLMLTVLGEIAQAEGSKKITPTNSYLGDKIERGNREAARALIALEEHGYVKCDVDLKRQPIRIIEIL
jgi:CTP-dependent riboflavin kinase